MAVVRLTKQVQDLIAEIASERRRSSFAYFDPDDIAQEVWGICLRALRSNTYDKTKGDLAHWLRSCVTNRLRNLKRDSYYRPAKSDDEPAMARARTRMNLVNAIPMGSEDIESLDSPLAKAAIFQDQPIDHAMGQELLDRIRSSLSTSQLNDLNILLDGGRVPPKRLSALRAYIREVIGADDGQAPEE